jgi:5'-nucleotidase (lipoprotein e(P4) family)
MKKQILLSASIMIFSIVLAVLAFMPKSPQALPAPRSMAERLNEYMTLAVLYQQTAAEVRAMQYQTYNSAKPVLDAQLKAYRGSKKPAVVVDIDETILDNCQFQAQCILGNFQYPVRWDEWCNLAIAPAIPGSVEFLNYAHSKGVAVFYVSNRKAHLKDATVKNLVDAGCPNVKDQFLLFRTAENSKTARRAIIEKDHEILMLFGDNMGDFSADWEHKTIEDRFRMTDENKKLFGTKYFVLPNSTYGDWEAAIYGYDYSLESAVKYRMRKEALKGF